MNNYLQKAKEAVEDRMNRYGLPSANFKLAAGLFSQYLGIPISTLDYCILMMLVKIARLKGTETADSLTDIAGYIEAYDASQSDAPDSEEYYKLWQATHSCYPPGA